jgi:hypothetical protein
MGRSEDEVGGRWLFLWRLGGASGEEKGGRVVPGFGAAWRRKWGREGGSKCGVGQLGNRHQPPAGGREQRGCGATGAGGEAR